LPWLGQSLARRFDRVEGITLGADAAVAADASPDFHNALATLIKEGSEAGAIGSRPLDRPHPPTGTLLASHLSSVV